MFATIAITLPFFAVVGLGFLAAARGLLDDKAVGSLNVFVFYFAMPALIIGTLGAQDFSAILDLSFLTAWALAGLLMFAAGGLAARFLLGGGLAESAIVGQAASIGNLGFLALPLLLSVFGAEAAGLIAMALVVDLVILIPLSIGLLEWSRGGGAGTGVAAAIRQTAKGVILNPFLLSIAAGIAVAASGIGFVGPLERFLDFLGAAAGPAALFALGVSLAGRRLEGEAPGIAVMAFSKLIAHPVVAYVLLTQLGVTGIERVIGTLIAAMPIAGNVFVIAETYGVLVRRSSAAILVSTILAVITVAIALRFFGVA